MAPASLLLVLHNIAFAADRIYEVLAGCSHYVISELEQWRARISEDLREDHGVRRLGNFQASDSRKLGIQHLVKSFLSPRSEIL